MGKQNSKLKPEVLEDLRQNTEFSGNDLFMYRLVLKGSDSGVLHLGLVGFWALSAFRNWIFRWPGVEAPTQLGLLKGDVISYWNPSDWGYLLPVGPTDCE